MSTFLAGMNAHLVSILGNPETTSTKYVLLACAFLALYVGLDRSSALLDAPLRGPGDAMGAAFFGILITLGALQAADMFAPESIREKETMFRALTMTGLTVGLLAPLTARFYSSSFKKTLFCWLLSGALMLGVLAITNAAIKSMDTGTRNKRSLVEEPDY